MHRLRGRAGATDPGYLCRRRSGPPSAISDKNHVAHPGLFGSDFDIREALGYDGQLSVGYALGDGWRFELEGTYGRSNIFGVLGTPFPATASGSIRNWGLMTNALFDLDVGSPYIYPYLGLGVGYQSTHLNGFVLSQTNRPFSVFGERR